MQYKKLGKVLNVNIVAINKRCSKLKDWSLIPPKFHIATVTGNATRTIFSIANNNKIYKNSPTITHLPKKNRQQCN